MKVEFTEHAAVKLRQRGISRELVEETVISPDFVRPSYRERRVAYKKHRTNYLAVIFVVKKGVRVVITQHWVAKLTEEG